MMSVLDRIVSAKRVELERLRPRRAELRRAAEMASRPRSFEAALQRPGEVALIAEVKRRSPSAGPMRPELDVSTVAHTYEAAGAAAVSVLTDAEFFGGGLDDLRRVREAVSLPVLRKDFVLDPIQVWEARAAGADAVLLIVRILEGELLAELVSLARELGLGALVEVHDAGELQRALRAGATVLGVNNRDLATFRTDLGVALRLSSAVPPERVLVAESGIRAPADVDRLGNAGVDATLVGETLMRAPDVGAAAASLVGRSRRPRSPSADSAAAVAGRVAHGSAPRPSPE